MAGPPIHHDHEIHTDKQDPTSPAQRRRAARTTSPTEDDRAGPTSPDDLDDLDADLDDEMDLDDADEYCAADLERESPALSSDDAREAGYQGLSDQERDELDRIARRAADQELIAELAHAGFAGAAYDAFADDLARYAISVLGGWLRTGYIFSLSRALAPSEHESLEFADSKEARLEVVAMTIAVALPKFRVKALVEGGWDPEKGASLTTYFMGACVFAFPNQLRNQRRERRRWFKQDQASNGELVDLDEAAVTDPADIAVGKIHVLDHLRELDPRTARLVAAKLDDYTQAEMQEMFSEDSLRAVEGQLYRWRTREQKRLTQGQQTRKETP